MNLRFGRVAFRPAAFLNYIMEIYLNSIVALEVLSAPRARLRAVFSPDGLDRRKLLSFDANQNFMCHILIFMVRSVVVRSATMYYRRCLDASLRSCFI